MRFFFRAFVFIVVLPLGTWALSHGDLPASHEATPAPSPTCAHVDADAQHVVMERMLTTLPPHFRPRPHISVSHLQQHELIFAIRVRNMDLLQREVLLRATPPPPPSPGQSEESGDDALYQRWFSYDEVTAFTAVQESAQAVLAWLGGLAEEAGTGAMIVTHVSPRHDFIRVTAPVGLWAMHLRTVFTAYEHTKALSSSSVQEKRSGNAAPASGEATGNTEDAGSAPMSWPSPSLILRADSYSLPAAVAQHVETVFNTVQVPLRTRRAHRHRLLVDATEHVASNMDADGDGYGEIPFEPQQENSQDDLQDDSHEVHRDAVMAPVSSMQLQHGGAGVDSGVDGLVESDQPVERGSEEGGADSSGLDNRFTDTMSPRPSSRPTRSLRPSHSRSPSRPAAVSRTAVSPRPTPFRRPSPRPNVQVSTADSASQDVTIPFLRNLYQIPTMSSSYSYGASTAQVNRANILRQSVFETNQESFSNKDLSFFQSTFSLHQQAAVAVGGFETDSCALSGSSGAGCFEGNLDVQYITGTTGGSGVRTEVWHVDADTGDPFLNWILAASNDPSPPAVTSISWGNDERYTSPSVMAAFEREAIKLAAIGVTILVSSGDNGAAGYDCKKGACDQDSSSDGSYWSRSSSWTGTGFFPKFPAGCPWVTAVGATSGPESGHTEVAAASSSGDVITTGGGFSGHWPTPAWQSNAVPPYTQAAHASGTGFNPRGRGYPDVALIGVGYQVVVQRQFYTMYGTSASTPVFAGMITLINLQRASKGRGPVGFLNPTIYAANNAASFDDVTSGTNNCCSSIQASAALCCAHGFTAAAGWDPLTGLGTVSYPALLDMFT